MPTSQKQQLSRGAGLLMPISSLPSAYGIGTLGKSAYEFADFGKNCGARYWQVLPIGPTSYGDSPYQAFSAFAGNPYFIDLDKLMEEGLLIKSEVEGFNWGGHPSYVDYAAVYESRFTVLRMAFARSLHREEEAYKKFLKDNSYWVEDYALYMSLKNHFGGKAWQEWDENIKKREKKAVTAYKKKLSEDIEFWKFVQYKFDEQWNALKTYVNSNGMEIIGDIPLYVSMDSTDVWVHPDLFELDEDLEPINIAGVPPDLFSATGQRWGNPLYRWDVMEKDGFKWWSERMKSCGYHYDVVRIDHFIGVVNYWSIPATCPTAIEGAWIQGPGKKLTDMINRELPETKLIAEDLGVLTQPVQDLIDENGYPGMKILEFALNAEPDSQYLPHNYKTDNIIVYTGTHDNETLAGALNGCSWEQIQRLVKYYNAASADDLPATMIRAAYASNGRVAIIPVQDLLGLDNSARMNFPSTLGDNWKWRVTGEQLRSIDTAYYKSEAKRS